MIGTNDFDPLKSWTCLAAGRLWCRCEKVLSSHSPQAADELGLDDGELLIKILAARRRLDWQGVRLTGGRREDVQNIDILASHLLPLDDDVVEQLACPAYERFAEPVFVAPGASPQEPVGVRIATPKTVWVRVSASLYNEYT